MAKFSLLKMFKSDGMVGYVEKIRLEVLRGNIEIKNRRNITERVINAINGRVNATYNNRIIVNQIGETTYISLDFLKSLTIEQIEDILQNTW